MAYEAELAFAKELALEAGAIARKYFALETGFDIKDDNSPVTKADLEINQLVIERCQQNYPGVAILGEEASTENTEAADLLWVCDPIDGTIPYALGMPISTFCLALVVKGVPVLGVIYDFNGNRLLSAIKDQGAWLNDKPLIRANRQPMKLVSLEWWHSAAFNLGDVRLKLANDGYQVPNFASGAFTSMGVAFGKMTGLIYAGDKPWDAAATKVIIEELGGKVVNLRGEEQSYNQKIMGAVIASSPEEAAALVDYIVL